MGRAQSTLLTWGAHGAPNWVGKEYLVNKGENEAPSIVEARPSRRNISERPKCPTRYASKMRVRNNSLHNYMMDIIAGNFSV